MIGKDSQDTRPVWHSDSCLTNPQAGGLWNDGGRGTVASPRKDLTA